MLQAEKVCADCRQAQALVMWFKTLTYLHAMTLHELTPAISRDVGRYKASFRLRRRASPRLDMAAQVPRLNVLLPGLNIYIHLSHTQHLSRLEMLPTPPSPRLEMLSARSCWTKRSSRGKNSRSCAAWTTSTGGKTPSRWVRLWPAWKCVVTPVSAHIQARQPIFTIVNQVRLWPAWKCCR